MLGDPIKVGLLRTAIRRYRELRFSHDHLPRTICWGVAWRQARNIEDCGCGD